VTTAYAARIKDELTEQPGVAPEAIKRLQETTGGVAVNVGYTLLHHPAIAMKYEPFGLSFFTDGMLPPRDRELIILRTSWLCHSPYEWAHHVIISRACGVSEEELRRLQNADLKQWRPPDAELLSAVDTVVRDHTHPLAWPESWRVRVATRHVMDTL
jgi:4-carboxymuconolactone decarboxylase